MPDRTVSTFFINIKNLTFLRINEEFERGLNMEEEVRKEYERIKALFKDSDENMLKLMDGAFIEAARLRVELNDIHSIVKETGLIKINPNNQTMQKELPVSRMLPKVRANYTNVIFKLASVLGKNVSDEDLGMDDYE